MMLKTLKKCRKTPLILILTAGLSSCSLFVDNIDSQNLKERELKLIQDNKNTYCSMIQKNILINDNKASQESFNQFIAQNQQKYQFKYIDKVILWSLIQMNIRPDQSSSSAKLQVLLRINGETKFYNSYSKSKGHPYLVLLKKLAKDYKAQYTLKEYARILDTKYRYPIYVNKNLEEFLMSQKNNILKDATLKSLYLRGDEVLKKGEKISRLNYSKLVRKFARTQNKNAKISTQLNDFNFSDIHQTSCNFSMEMYNESQYIISDEEVKSHTFGIKENTNIFMASSSQKFSDKFERSLNPVLFAGSSNYRGESICLLKNKFKKNDFLWVFSSDSRDPGQHIHHLIEYGLTPTNDSSFTKQVLQFARHEFFRNPSRFIIESKRSSQDQLQKLLSLDIPLYNAKKLGRVWMYKNNQNFKSFYIDNRKPGHLSCKSMY